MTTASALSLPELIAYVGGSRDVAHQALRHFKIAFDDRHPRPRLPLARLDQLDDWLARTLPSPTEEDRT